MLQALSTHVDYYASLNLFGLITQSPFIISTCVLPIFIIAKFIKKDRSAHLLVLITYFVFTFYSILDSGHAWRNYIVQIIPWSVLILGITLNAVPYLKRLNLTIIFVVFVLISSVYRVNEYKRICNEGLTFHGRSKEIYQYFQQRGFNYFKPYFLSDHLVHWYTDTKPIRREVTHPSNLTRPELFQTVNHQDTSPKELLQLILNEKPNPVVKSVKTFYLDDELENYLNNYLQTHYTVDKVINGSTIYVIK